MKKTTLNPATMYALHHCALAMQGRSESAFDSDTLRHRLEACQRVHDILTAAVPCEGNGGSQDEIDRFKEVICHPDDIAAVEELNRLGRITLKLVKDWGNRYRYDTFAGERV